MLDIVQILEENAGHAKNSTKTRQSRIGFSDFIEEFFVGIAHDKNMSRLATFFEKNPQLKQSLRDNDFFAKVGKTNEVSFDEFYKKKIEESDLVFPIFTDYKLVALD